MCYNGNTSNCLSTAPTPPLSKVDSYTTLAGMSNSQHSIKTLDSYGNITGDTKYDYNGTTYVERVSTYGSSACGGSTSVKNNLCTSTLYYNTGSTYLSKVTNTYDSTGNLLTSNTYMPGNTTLTNTNTFNANGTVATSKDPSGITASFTYGACNGFGLTKTTVNSLYSSKTYDCNGGVPLTSTDVNGNVTYFGYANSGGTADPYYRLMSVTDPQSNVVYKTYSPTSFATTFSFNSGSSVLNTYGTLDGYGRVVNVQKQEPAGWGSNFDTVSYTYGYSTTGGLGAFRTSSVPCAGASGAHCTVGLTTSQLDYMGRLSTITDGGSGVNTFAYTQNDVTLTLSPAPSGENFKRVLSETNGLGLKTIVCPNTTSGFGGVSCGASTSETGYPTATAMTAGTGTFTLTSTLGSQTRTQVFDAAGRLTSATVPEYNGNGETYAYDTASGCSGTYTNGRLAKKVDAKGNVLCYSYDNYGRLSSVAANGTLCHLYFYDNSAGFSGTIPTGITVNNALGSMVEAATSNCSTTLLTDEWFSRDNLGRKTDVWEMTPHSGAYYHASDSYFANNVPNTEDFVGQFTTTYGIDGVGRWTSAQIGAANTVTSVTYNASQRATQIAYPTGEASTTTTASIAQHAYTFTVASATNMVVNMQLNVDTGSNLESVQITGVSGTTITILNPGFHHSHNSGVAVVSQTGDMDNFAYDSNTGRMTQFQFVSDESNGSLTGALSWNANGTLSALALTDTVNSGGTQTCTMLYDDLARIASDLCGTGSTSVVRQTD